ncbi:MAG: exopolyphosphatase [Pedobacter sp.]|nr:MAG: exopolyphosphatase [Pedobacter sp.]
MRHAIIDLGTNTFHLIIAELTGTDPHVVFKTNEPVKLGEGSINRQLISAPAFERGIFALQDFRAIADSYGANTITAVATSALRSASNSASFINAAREQAGININIISGDEEAGLIFKGVKASGAITGKALIMDIGGGSTEFILCSETELYWKKSYDIGAARLLQRFFKSDPLSLAEREGINLHLTETLQELKMACEQFRPTLLIGSAGAFETFTEMLYPDLDLDAVSTHEIELDAYHQLSATFISSTHAERLAMKGLIPLRVDMILMATLITDLVLELSAVETLKVSTFDLKMGVLESLKPV